MWNLPRPEVEPMSPLLAGGLLSTVPPRKVHHAHISLGCSPGTECGLLVLKDSVFWQHHRILPAEDVGLETSQKACLNLLGITLQLRSLPGHSSFSFRSIVSAFSSEESPILLCSSCTSDPVLTPDSQKIHTNVSGPENAPRKQQKDEDLGLASSHSGGQREPCLECWVGC